LKEIIIRLGTGTIQDGFKNVTVELKYDRITQWEDRSNLRPNPELQELLHQWQVLYPTAIQTLSHGLNQSPIFDTDTVTNVSTQDLTTLNYHFKTGINNWLSFGDFARIDRRLRTDLNVLDRILTIVVSEQLQIWQLPWHFWDLFDDYRDAVEVFSKPQVNDVRSVEPQHNGKVNILALSGRDPRLNLNTDFLKNLPQAYAQPLETNSATEIAEQLNQSDRSWDIFIFNGHGNTTTYNSCLDGVIYLDNQTQIEISRLKIEIKIAVDRGLQIAIFNCCNGLGLAEQLSDLHIPYIIVMREIIPNQCAQDFLKQLLTQYSRGSSFPAAFRQARESLRLSAGGFAQFADWLPILFHNPLSNYVTWRDLSTTVFSSLIPSQAIVACRYLSQANHRMLTIMGLSLCSSILALHFQSDPQVNGWENLLVDRLQSERVAAFALAPSQVTVVNYDDAISLSGIVADDGEIRKSIELVEAKAQPIAWVIGLSISNNTNLFDGHIFQGCPNKSTNILSNNRLRLGRCDRQLMNEVLKKHGFSELVLQGFRLNTNVLFGRNHPIDRVNLSQIFNQSKSNAELKKLFDRKIIVVGDFESKDLNAAQKAAIAIDQIVRAKDPHQFLPLLVYRSISEQFLWIFSWSVLVGSIWSSRRWKLSFVAMIGGQVVIICILLFIGQGLPIVLTSISMISVGSVMRAIFIGANTQRRMYNSLVKPL
jgi:hypothetical protein